MVLYSASLPLRCLSPARCLPAAPRAGVGPLPHAARGTAGNGGKGDGWRAAKLPKPVSRSRRREPGCWLRGTMLAGGALSLALAAAHRRGIFPAHRRVRWLLARAHGALRASRPGRQGREPRAKAGRQGRQPRVKAGRQGRQPRVFAASARMLARASTLPALGEHECSESRLRPPCLCWFTATLC